jgi:hypothetical protein
MIAWQVHLMIRNNLLSSVKSNDVILTSLAWLLKCDMSYFLDNHMINLFIIISNMYVDKLDCFLDATSWVKSKNYIFPCMLSFHGKALVGKHV